jgi:hypothetical protein
MNRTALATFGVWLGCGAAALACPVCFQIEDGPVTSGIRAAVLVLVLITSGVLVAVGAWLKTTGLLSSDKTDRT